MDRLQEKGLHGVLHSLDGFATSGNDTFHTMRHLHPREVALLNGLNPKYVSNDPQFHLRLELAAVGQMGSPLQSNWVINQILFQLNKQGFMIESKHPRVAMVELCRSIFPSRNDLWANDSLTIYQKIFEREIESICAPLVRTQPHDEELSFTQSLREQLPSIEKGLENEEQLKTRSVAIGKGKGGVIGIPKGFSTITKKFEGEIACLQQEPAPFVSKIQVELPSKIQEPQQHDDRLHKVNLAFDHNGGVAGFETKRKQPDIDNTESKRIKIHDEQSCSPTCAWTQPIVDSPGIEDQTVTNQNIGESNDVRNTVWVGYIGEPHGTISTVPDSTVGQLIVAESRITQEPETNFRAFGIVGEPTPPSTKLHHGDIILIQCSQKWDDPKCPLLQTSFKPPNFKGMTRSQALLQQLGWVAIDEMTFYLQKTGAEMGFLATAPFVLGIDEDNPNLAQWIHQNIEIAKATDGNICIYTCCMAMNHWFPICFQVHTPSAEQHVETQEWLRISIVSTPEGENMMAPIVQQVLAAANMPPCNFQTQIIGSSFPADCGFQAIAWIRAHVLHTSCVNMTPTDAYSLRCDFAKHLVEIHADQIQVEHLVLGGMQDSQAKHELKILLEQHGVKQDRSKGCVDLLVEKLGIPAIKSTLSSPRAWQDLKTRASACQPPIQLVLAEELRSVIEQRIKEGKPFGRKENKKKNPNSNKGPLRIDASQIVIPATVFQQDGGEPVPQISAHDIHANTKGIVVLNIEDAIPYFSLREQISNEGLGLLVLEHGDHRLPPMHTVVRFPATCVGTQEPILLSAALFQIGKKEVKRNIPKERAKVDEIPTMVIRTLVFRDEFKHVSWEDFCKKPVKQLFEMEPFEGLGSNGSIIDVWDRQYLTMNFRKSKQSESEMFIVTCRVTKEDGQRILQGSGKEGLFFEPRTDNGRQPHPDYRVIWLARMGLAEVQLARQTAPKPTWVVRNGERYGLRASTEDIVEIHKIHKPEIPFMDGSNTQTFRVEPLPFGTTKQSLLRVFQAWGWEARPLQPQGQSRDHQGVAWPAVSTSNPTHWVFTMEHGDVLVTVQNSSKPGSSSVSVGAPVASSRTLKHLSDNQAVSSAPDVMQESMLHTDPWANWKPSGTSKTPKMLSASQIATMEANIEKKLIASIGTNQGEDAAMNPVLDGRVDHLEKQVQQLHDTVGKIQHNAQVFQAQQSQHNTQVVNELSGVKQQVEHQNNSIRSM